MLRRIPPLAAAGLAVAIALLVAAAWCGRPRTPAAETALEATVLVRITRHDELGMPSRTAAVREAGRVRAIVEALGVDAHPEVPCPLDYATAELGLVLSGRDVYARRNVYVWGLFRDAGAAPSAASPTTNVPVVVVSSSGCRGGPAADVAALRREMLASDAGP